MHCIVKCIALLCDRLSVTNNRNPLHRGFTVFIYVWNITYCVHMLSVRLVFLYAQQFDRRSRHLTNTDKHASIVPFTELRCDIDILRSRRIYSFMIRSSYGQIRISFIEQNSFSKFKLFINCISLANAYGSFCFYLANRVQYISFCLMFKVYFNKPTILRVAVASSSRHTKTTKYNRERERRAAHIRQPYIYNFN